MSCRFVTIFCFLTSLISRSGERAIQAEGAQKCVYITELTRHVISAQVLSQGRNMQDYLDLDLTPQSLNSGGGLCEFFNQPLQLCWRNRDFFLPLALCCFPDFLLFVGIYESEACSMSQPTVGMGTQLCPPRDMDNAAQPHKGVWHDPIIFEFFSADWQCSVHEALGVYFLCSRGLLLYQSVLSLSWYLLIDTS